MSTYVPLDLDGNEVGAGDMNSNARLPKTELQHQALKACGLLKFESAPQHKQFKKLEDNSLGAKDSAIVYRAWMYWCIGNYKGTMGRLISKIGSNLDRTMWSKGKEEKILAEAKARFQPKVPLVKAAALPHPVTKRRIADEVEQVIASVGGLLKVNVIRTGNNLDNAGSIANDIAEHPERNVQTWYDWFVQDKWRDEHRQVYASMAKVWESWPQAFESTSGGANPLGLSINS